MFYWIMFFSHSFIYLTDRINIYASKININIHFEGGTGDGADVASQL